MQRRAPYSGILSKNNAMARNKLKTWSEGLYLFTPTRHIPPLHDNDDSTRAYAASIYRTKRQLLQGILAAFRRNHGLATTIFFDASTRSIPRGKSIAHSTRASYRKRGPHGPPRLRCCGLLMDFGIANRPCIDVTMPWPRKPARRLAEPLVDLSSGPDGRLLPYGVSREILVL